MLRKCDNRYEKISGKFHRVPIEDIPPDLIEGDFVFLCGFWYKIVDFLRGPDSKAICVRVASHGSDQMTYEIFHGLETFPMKRRTNGKEDLSHY